jgi:hypothetical protein
MDWVQKRIISGKQQKNVKKTQNWDKYYFLRQKMVVKVDKGEEFVKSGKKLISEYPVIRVKPSKLKKSE